MEGYLQKKGKINRQWKNRWFEVDGIELLYFKRPGGPVQGKIPLDLASIQVEVAEQKSKAQFPFSVLCKTAGVRKILLGAENDENREDWVRALQKVAMSMLEEKINREFTVGERVWAKNPPTGHWFQGEIIAIMDKEKGDYKVKLKEWKDPAAPREYIMTVASLVEYNSKNRPKRDVKQDAADQQKEKKTMFGGRKDPVMDRIKALEKDKRRALNEEDIDLARRIHEELDLIKKSKLAQLQEEKEKAVEAEDYERAKTCKLKMEALAIRKAPEAKPAGIDMNTRMMRRARNLVSKKKRRFKQDGFDLDLTYIYPNMIAMGFPSEGTEASYRNPMPEVQDFFTKYHKANFKVYNLCSERKYDHEKFTGMGGQVLEVPFDDHNPPPFDNILPFCRDVDQFLDTSGDGVVAIHCKAGKGRTGMVICAYMVYKKIPDADTTERALKYYGITRTKNGKGVTIPSQQRYIRYTELLMELGKTTPALLEGPLPAPCLKLTHIVLHGVPRLDGGGCTPFIQLVGQDGAIQMDSKKTCGGKLSGFYDGKTSVITLPMLAFLTGDVKFVIKDAGKNKKNKDKVCEFWLNTFFIKNCNNMHVRMEKLEIDRAIKDKKHKKFDHDFAIEVFFEDATPDEAREAKSALEEQQKLQATAKKQKKKKKAEGKEAAKPQGEVLKVDEMPSEIEVMLRFDHFISGFKRESARKGMEVLPLAAKWSLLCLDAKEGGRAAFYDASVVSKEDDLAHLKSGDEDEDEEEDTDADEVEEEGVFLEALVDFQLENDGDYTYLRFHAHDTIRLLYKSDEEWWFGEMDGEKGYFPVNHVIVPEE